MREAFAERGVTARRGALLMEVMLALTLFVTAGMVILSLVGQSVATLRAARDKEHAVDLARSAMAKMEGGIETAEGLNGPVRPWRDDAAGEAAPDDGSAATPWELRIRTEPSPFDGLTLVTVTASKSADVGGGGAGVSYTMRQLVRLAAKGEDTVGRADDLSGAARRGASGGTPTPSAGPGRPAGGGRP